MGVESGKPRSCGPHTSSLGASQVPEEEKERGPGKKRNERFPTFIRPRCTVFKQQKENGVDRLRICKIGKETTITSLVRGQENPDAASPMPRKDVPQKEQEDEKICLKKQRLKP